LRLIDRLADVGHGVSSGGGMTATLPQDFTPQEATEALKKDEAVDQARVLLDRLIASGVIERRTPGDRSSSGSTSILRRVPRRNSPFIRYEDGQPQTMADLFVFA
jgi:hypothetical protein